MRSYKKAAAVLLGTLTAMGVDAAVPGSASPPSVTNDLVVHEWGTFTSLQGSDGSVQDGLHHEEERLPGFVHGRDPLHEAQLVSAYASATPVPRPRPCASFKCMEFYDVQARPAPLVVTQKMETPVLYFYTKQPQKVNVEIGFPQGIISQYYPKPVDFAPAIGGIKEIGGGRASFTVDLVNEELPVPVAPATSAYAPARNVHANFLRSGAENERYIFYRGLGNFQNDLKAVSVSGALELQNRGAGAIPAAYLLQVTEKGGAIRALGKIGIKASRTVERQEIHALKEEAAKSESQGVEAFLAKAGAALAEGLEASGLYADEARAMVDTWKKSYFRTPGLRVLYVLNRDETDGLLPLTLQPQPKELVRTLVGRVEVMTDVEEKALLAEVHEKGLQFETSKLGRFAEPKLRRLRQLATDEDDRLSLDELIARNL